jgi:hypothetical protein
MTLPGSSHNKFRDPVFGFIRPTTKVYSGNSSITSYTRNKCPSDPGKFSVPARKLDTSRFRAYTYNFEVILTIWFNCPVVRLCHSEVFARTFV